MESVNAADILKHRGILKTEPGDGMPSDESAAEAFLLHVRDNNACETFVGELFSDGIRPDPAFFQRLWDLHRYYGATPSCSEGVGIVWSQAVRSLPEEDRQSLLGAFVGQGSPRVFQLLGSIWVVIRDHSFPASFLAEWITHMVRAVQRDSLQGGAWAAVRTLCVYHPDTAFDVLHLLSLRPDQTQLAIASFMLGVLRTCDTTGPRDESLRKVEAFFNDHLDGQFRGVVAWSWAATAQERALTEDELDALFARAEISPDDRSTVVCVVCRLLSISKEISAETARRYREWIGARVSPSLPSDAKNAVVRAAHALLLANGGDLVPTEVSGWLLAIQPVALDCIDTWQCVAGALSGILKKDLALFIQTFERLCGSGAATLQRLFHGPQLRWLLTEMGGESMDTLVGRLCVSRDTETRRLGLFLFDSLGMLSFPLDTLNSSGVASQLLFYESQRVALSPKAIARILVAISSSAEAAKNGFRSEVFDELKLQARNFAGECRGELAARGEAIPLVQTALAEVSTYFTDLDRAHQAGINGMEVTGHRRAALVYRRRLSRQVTKSAESNSVLLSMAKSIRLLYGRTTSQFVGGVLGPAAPLAETSVSMEMPILELSDPEEMAMRRVHATAAIERLLQPEQNNARGEGCP